MISSFPATSALKDLNQDVSTSDMSSAAQSPASLPAASESTSESASEPSAFSSLPPSRSRPLPARPAVELLSHPRPHRPASDPPPPPLPRRPPLDRPVAQDARAGMVVAKSTPPHRPPPPPPVLTPQDIKDVCKAYLQTSTSPDAATRSLIPFLYGISSAWAYESGSPTERLQVPHRMMTLAEEIARTPTFEVPPIRLLWEAAQVLAPQMDRLLRQPEVIQQMPVGAQLALNAFLSVWDRVLGEGPSSTQTSTLSKCVPVESALTLAPAFRLNIGLTPSHPPAGTLVASSTPRTLSKDFSWSPVLPPPLITLTSVNGGLLLDAAPADVKDKRHAEAARHAMSTLEAELQDAAAKGQGLSDALRRFNTKVAKEWQLRPLLGNSATQGAGLVRTNAAAKTCAHTVWFRFEDLGKEDGVRALLTEPDAGYRLRGAYEVAALSTARQLRDWNKRHPDTSANIRSELLKGVATQHCIEITQSSRSKGMHLKFLVGVQDVRQVMTAQEQDVLDAILKDVEATLKSAKFNLYPLKPREPRKIPVVTLDKGDPMGCLQLLEKTARTEAPKPVQPSPSAYPSPVPSQLRFNQLRSSLLQPLWLDSLSTDTVMEDPGLLLTDIDTAFSRDYDAAMRPLLDDIRTPGVWSQFSAELAPRLLADCPGWPKGRALFIHDAVNGDLRSTAGPKGTGMEPIRLALGMANQHYRPLADGRMLDVPLDGDCFYTAVLAAMQPKERLTLLKACGCAEEDRETLGPAALSLRRHFADYVDRHREDYRKQIIEWHAVLD
ncbi:hypothetical protein DES44_1708 [Roseateles depolymerans]|uniref:Uncharacterized protein n=2 Tax=Roseateles depolymerans TaxID=76731 RepID=A0A0U3CY06_9BURK|nr:hypothetical protein RD2015_1764 [Roseateles depolymerans]REG19215.1 hypothetical protein DES44_1708 [Roseateles depolymerans]